MADRTEISYVDSSWNPIVGCQQLSAGCDHCWAKRQIKRMAHHRKEYEDCAKWDGTTRLIEDKLDQPMRWRKPRRIAVCFMGDLFHKSVTEEMCHKVFMVMHWPECKRHTFFLLTKRPGNAHGDFGDLMVASHIWFGLSAEDQGSFDRRVGWCTHLWEANHWLSLEPLLGPINLRPWIRNYGWIVIGGESGPGARPMNPDWVRSIRDQCRAAGIPLFVKQMGGWPNKHLLEDLPKDLRIREFPK